MFIINPGTEKQENTTEVNAIESAKQFARDLNIDGLRLQRRKEADDNFGWYGFRFILGDKEVCIDIPGVEPDIFLKGEPFISPRCYVDGSSWLYGYGLGVALDKLVVV